jgi:hypothetical protein
MKLFFAIIIAMNTVSPIKGGAVFSFLNKTTYKFTDTQEGVLLTHVFKFKNIGYQPLAISDYKVACSCTKAKFSKEPILPGQESAIEVMFDTNGKFGYQDRILSIYSNAKKSPIKLRIKVYVYPVKPD